MTQTNKPPKETLQQEVWRRAIMNLERELLEFCPVLPGGKLPIETCLQYASRSISGIERAVGRLREAQQEYLRIGGKIV